MANKLYYYVSGNTAAGTVNYISSNLSGINTTFILRHPSYTLQTNIIKELLKKYEEKYFIEVVCSSAGEEFLDGFIIRELSLAVLTEDIMPKNLSDGLIVDLSTYLAIDLTVADSLSVKIEQLKELAFGKFKLGLSIHDRLEAIFINEMDFTKADHIAETFIAKLLFGIEKKDRKLKTYKRLFGTNTKDGAVNVVPQLLKDIDYRYHIKGRAGTGKSVFMNKVAKACSNLNLDIELYYCSFDPSSIDMVRIPELNTCLFDSTDPHEFTLERNDSIIDFYEETVTQGTDEKFAHKINEITQEYKSYLKEGLQLLKQAHTFRQQIEMIYNKNFHTSMSFVNSEINKSPKR